MARIVTLFNLTSGAYTNITCQAPARKAFLQEDGSGPPAGIIVKWPNGTVSEYLSAQQPVQIENPGGGAGPLVGFPANTPAVQSYVGCGLNATQYCQVKSVGATSVLQLIEEN